MSPQAGFVLQDQVVPRLRSAIPKAVHCIGSEDAEELVQDSIAMAAKMFHNAEQANKKVSAGNIAYYTIQHIKSGRRSTGSSVVDVLAAGTQLQGNTRINSLEEVVAEDEAGEIFELHDVLSGDEEDPRTRAARKMDWEGFMAGLSSRDQAIIQFMIEGKTCPSMAKQLKIHHSTVRTKTKNIAIKVAEFMGADILIQTQRKPGWRDALTATRERLACREERKH
jgi:DNA-binding NarL/FixJ family response regulator